MATKALIMVQDRAYGCGQDKKHVKKKVRMYVRRQLVQLRTSSPEFSSLYSEVVLALEFDLGLSIQNKPDFL